MVVFSAFLAARLWAFITGNLGGEIDPWALRGNLYNVSLSELRDRCWHLDPMSEFGDCVCCSSNQLDKNVLQPPFLNICELY